MIHQEGDIGWTRAKLKTLKLALEACKAAGGSYDSTIIFDGHYLPASYVAWLVVHLDQVLPPERTN